MVFSTKDRRQLILSAWRDRLHAFMGGVLREADVVPEGVGGVSDHVHLLIGLRATHRLADVLRDLKRASSAWVHETIGDRAFGWQEGYGAFSVSASQRAVVRAYIAKQEEHHRARGFQEEYLALLQRSGIAFDEKHLW